MQDDKHLSTYLMSGIEEPFARANEDDSEETERNLKYTEFVCESMEKSIGKLYDEAQELLKKVKASRREKREGPAASAVPGCRPADVFSRMKSSEKW